MRLEHPFYKFNLIFDVERLRAEVAAIPEESWCEHPQQYNGNTALPLISTGGQINDNFSPPMAPTEHLEKMPYVKQVMGQFQTLLGRSRLMRLEPGATVPSHIDIQYYWRGHTRVHIPVTTDPAIRFHCEDQDIHMAAGEAWTFDNWRTHKVVNPTDVRRVHLVIDTFGSTAFWNMARPLGHEEKPRFFPYQEGAAAPSLLYEKYVGENALSPAEVDNELTSLIMDARSFSGNDPQILQHFQQLLESFRHEWRVIWYSTGPQNEGLLMLANLLDQIKEMMKKLSDMKLASNKSSALGSLRSLLMAMIHPGALAQAKKDYSQGAPKAAQKAAPGSVPPPDFDQPVFIVAAPRSGSTLLFEMMAEHRELWTVGGESHGQIEKIATLKPKNRDFHSNRLLAEDATPEICAALRQNFTDSLCLANKQLFRNAGDDRPTSIRFLEKTPKNALRIPFFKAMFPDAKFIFLHREARSNISSIIEAWRSGRFTTYPDLPGWEGLPWSLLLIPGWQDLSGAEIAQIATRQWQSTNDIILKDLQALPDSDWCSVSYEDVTGDPGAVLQKLCAFSGLKFGPRMREIAEAPLKKSRYTLTEPDQEKWRKNEDVMAPFIGETTSLAKKLNKLNPAAES